MSFENSLSAKRIKQSYIVTGETETEIKADFVNLFSDELNLHVFQYLDAKDLSACARVASHWHRLVNDPQLWKKLFLFRFYIPYKQKSASRPGLLHRPAPAHYRHPQRPHLSSSACHSADWKDIYRVNHNWQTGNCRVIEFQPVPSVDQVPVSHTRLIRYAPPSNPLVQFTKHVILTASYTVGSDPEIILWRTGEKNSKIGSLKSDIHKGVINDVYITCLKLDSVDEVEDEFGWQKRIVAGYSNGGFSIFEFDTILKDPTHSWRYREVVNMPSRLCGEIPVIACALHYPILVTCTAQFVLSVYSIVNTGEKVEYRLLHQLISFICKPPLDISLEEKDDEGRDKSGEWRIIVAYATGVYGGGWTVGIQEILFNSTSITSTTHCSPQISSSVFSFAPITTISYKSSHLITAHSDNTIQLFHVTNSDNILQCTHTQTLYGHTGSVQAVAIDEYGKLISGAMDQSIKIWDLGIREKAEEDMEEKKGWEEQEYKEKGAMGEAVCVVTLNDAMDVDVEFKGVNWLGFDEGRIVSVNGGWQDGSRLRVGNEENAPAGWTSNGQFGVGVVKVWSFCDE